MKNTALKKFDKKNNLLVISSYPDVKEGKFANVSGVATYTYHMLPDLIDKLSISNRKVIVLAEKLKGVSETADKNGFLLHRCWGRKESRVFNQVYKSITKFKNVDKILFHFEFNMFGDLLVTGKLPFYLLLLKLRGKSVTLLLHQVVSDLNDLSGHINLKRGSIGIGILNFLLRIYYKMLLSFSSKVIVHDDILRDRLRKISRKPVFVISHGLGEYTEGCSREDSRKKLDIPRSHFVVLCFGFLTWYKGSDWILEQFAKYYDKTKDGTVRLILAGGKSATLKGKSHYNTYYDSLVDKAEAYPNIEITGFVPDAEVKHYFCASDVAILPYRTQMSASGPFSIGLSFDRPFLLSENMAGVLETFDVKKTLHDSDLEKEDLIFKLNSNSMFKKVIELVQNKRQIRKLADFSHLLGEERQWSKVTEKFLHIIDA